MSLSAGHSTLRLNKGLTYFSQEPVICFSNDFRAIWSHPALFLEVPENNTVPQSMAQTIRQVRNLEGSSILEFNVLSYFPFSEEKCRLISNSSEGVSVRLVT